MFAEEVNDDNKSPTTASTTNANTTVKEEPNEIPQSEYVELLTSHSESFINSVGSFLIDNFLFNFPHFGTDIETYDISDNIKRNLIIDQCSDL